LTAKEEKIRERRREKGRKREVKKRKKERAVGYLPELKSSSWFASS